MKELINFFIPFPIWTQWLIGALFTALGGIIIYAGRNYLKASEEFKKIIYTQLEGIIPDIVVYIEPEKIREQITASIIPIKTGGEIFKHFLPFFYVNSFSRDLEHYCKTARQTDWNKQIAHQFYPEMAKSGYISPKEKLNKAVNNLLKFAK
jgi:hypothetical protein